MTTRPATRSRFRPAHDLALLSLAGALATGTLHAAPEKPALPATGKAGAEQDGPLRYDSPEVTRMFSIHPFPRYPYGARLTGARGSGLFQIDFGKNGDATKVETLRSTTVGVLDRECIQTFRRWRLRHPGEVDEVRVPVNCEGTKGSVRWGI